MSYVLIAVCGLVAGFLVPQRAKTVAWGAVLAGCYVVTVVAIAVAQHGFDRDTAISFFFFVDRVPVQQPGLAGLVAAADAWVLCALVAAARLWLTGHRASRDATTDSSRDGAA